MPSILLDMFTEAAREAGNWLCELQLLNQKQRQFGDDKAADVESQRKIVVALAAFARKQRIPILAEEQDAAEIRELEEKHGVRMLAVNDNSRLPADYISVDPLDSSVNWKFWRRDWAVSIALVQDGRPQIGVVYLPRYDQWFTAERGRGAWLNGKRLTSPPSAKLAEVMIGLDMCKVVDAEFDRDVNLPLTNRARYFANLPSVAAMASVAEGSLAGWISANVRNWDAAAMAIVLEEMGSIFEQMEGDPIDWRRVKLPPVIAAGSPAAAIEVYPTPLRTQQQVSPTVKLNFAMQLPREAAERAIAISRELGEEYDTHFVLGEDSHLHMTIYAAEFARKDLAHVLAKAMQIFRAAEALSCKAKRVEAHQGYLGVEIERSEAIRELHQRVVEALAPLRVLQQDVAADYAMALTDEQHVNERRYGYADALDLYNPHFTLTRFKHEEEAVAAAERTKWDIHELTVRSFGVYAMGEHGTCKRQVLEYSA